MNAANAPSAMNANKICLIAAATAALMSYPALAATTTIGAAPSLYGITDVAIGPVVFVEPKLSTACNLTREELRQTLRRTLTGSPGLTLLAGEDATGLNGARVTLTPLILTSRTETDCVSWVRLEALNNFPVVIPPVQTPRLMTLRLWEQSRTATSAADKHQRLTVDALETLGRDFARAVLLAQPGKLPERETAQQREMEKQENLIRTLDDSVRQKLIEQQPNERLLPEPEKPANAEKADEKPSTARRFEDMATGHENGPLATPFDQNHHVK